MNTPEAEALDHMATLIFYAALTEKRAGELLDALFKGGSATVTKEGELLIYEPELMQQAYDQFREEPET